VEKKIKILGIGGSLEKRSSTLSALKYTLAAVSTMGAEIELIDLGKLKLPIYNPLKGIRQGGPALKKIIPQVHSSDGYIFASPEYHGTVSGAFKNLLDYFEFLSSYSPPYLSGKPCGAIATGGGDLSGAATVQTIVNIVHSFRGISASSNVSIASSQMHFDKGAVISEHVQRRLKRLAEEVYSLALKLKY
jgi:FMN reductase